MNTHSLQPTGHLSKHLKLLQPHFSRTSALLRDQLTNQEHSPSTQRIPVQPNLRQSYSLERRTFL